MTSKTTENKTIVAVNDINNSETVVYISEKLIVCCNRYEPIENDCFRIATDEEREEVRIALS